MKRKKNLWYIPTICLILLLTSCLPSDDFTPNESIELPPYETMAVDFNNFMDENPSATKASQEGIGLNWLYSRIAVGVWNTALFTTLAVPVAAFKAAFSNAPTLLDSGAWQWSYTVNGFAGQYTARLTGQLNGTTVQWEMYVSKTGVDAFDEFLWFSGISNRDGSAGIWLLNQSPDHPEKMLQIDWTRANDEINSMRYTWVRTTDDQGQPDLFNSSYLSYGKQDSELDIYYDIHAYDYETSLFSDVTIEWSSTAYNGRVKSPTYFLDQAWHCWNAEGEDVDCD